MRRSLSCWTWAAVIEMDALANAEHAWRDSPVLPRTGSLPLDNVTQTAARGLDISAQLHIFTSDQH